jgi:predicted transglutaminase-like cysteine proteinase
MQVGGQKRLAHFAAVGLILFAHAAGFLLQPRTPSLSELPGSIDGAYLQSVASIDPSPPELEGRPESIDHRLARAPFGMETEPIVGGLESKWRAVEFEIGKEEMVLASCRAKKPCPGPAQELLNIVAEGREHQGRARVGLINRAVNLAIVPVADAVQWGAEDHWSSPFETLRTGRGDCEDYAIVKYVALREAGLSGEDVKIVILRNSFPAEDHAVAAARVDGEWLILDNRNLTLVHDTDVTRATPKFLLDEDGVHRFTVPNQTALDDLPCAACPYQRG